jgi:ribose-phosphate pyrophosphokinase
MMPLVFALPGNAALALDLCQRLPAEPGELQLRRFPDGESYLRYANDLSGRDVLLVCTLDRPDEKILGLYLAACTAKELGAKSVGLVLPYLAYMRQDARFNPGEGISSVHFARLISSAADWMVTVDPHLHRHASLDQIYSIPTRVAHAAPAIAAWISEEVENPVVIGPDAESEQWAAEVANAAGCPWTVLQKIRRGDKDVAVSVPDPLLLQGRTPVLVDDIVSTARTMAAAVGHLARLGTTAPVCVAVHPIFADDAFEVLQRAGAGRIASCNTVRHASNAINIGGQLELAIRALSL